MLACRRSENIGAVSSDEHYTSNYLYRIKINPYDQVSVLCSWLIVSDVDDA